MDDASNASVPSLHLVEPKNQKNLKIEFFLSVLIIFVLAGVFVGPTSGPGKARESAAMQTSQTIALAMFQFANDHDGKYPVGASSTEVFQQLLDGNYVSDPALSYVQMSGKRKPRSNKLKPENISFDVTIPVDSHSPQDFPLVFLTGYRINYHPDGSAVPLPSAAHPFHGLAACYHSNSAAFLGPNPAGSSQDIEHFIPLDFDPKGQHFQQLTPDGPLPPAPSGS